MSQNKHTEARELMCSGALLFFSHGQVHSDLIPFSAWGLQAGRGLVEGYRLCLALTLPVCSRRGALSEVLRVQLGSRSFRPCCQVSSVLGVVFLA